MNLPEIIQKIIRRYFKYKYLDYLRKNKIIIIIISVFIFLIFLFSFTGYRQESVREEWAVVKKGTFIIDLVETGEVEAVSQKLVRAPMMWSDKLQVVDLVPEATLVKKGDFIIQFDVSDLQDKRDLEEDELISLKADFQKTVAQQALKMSNLENSLKLTQYSYDQAVLQLEMQKYESEVKKEEARLQLKQAEIDLEQKKKEFESQKIINRSELIKIETSIKEAENNVREIEDRINKLQLVAPIDGMVVYQEVGSHNSRERLKNGYTARPGQSLMSIPDLSKMQIKLYVNEVDRLKIRTGMYAQIRLDAYPDAEFSGTVSKVARLAQTVTGAKRLKGFVIYVDVEGTDPRLKPGMTAKVRIILETLQNVVYVPIGTIFEVEGQPVVFPKGTNKPYAVYLGPRNNAFIVIERGVKPGMYISWINPLENVFMLGMAEEKRKVEEATRNLRESFEVFHKHGILYDYENEKTSETKKLLRKDQKGHVKKLPPSVPKRLQEKNK